MANWPGAPTPPDGKRSSKQMYPADDFPCPAYAVLGNHDYQRWPESKVDAELEYARSGRNGSSPTRWTMPSRWYRFEFPAKNPLVTFLALDSNMPRADGKEKEGRDFTLTPQQQAEQLAWFEGELKRPRTTPFVARHRASSRLLRWTSWRPSGIDPRLGPLIPQIPCGPVYGRPRP